MKRILIIILAVLTIVNCSNDDSATPQKQFVVDKIFDYNNNLLAEYYYNNENQLIKIAYSDPATQQNSEYTLEYLDNKISKIEYINYTFPQFNHTILNYYNEEGQLKKDELYKANLLIETLIYVYYDDGKLKQQYKLGNEDETITYFYNNTNNVQQAKIRYLDPQNISNPDDYIEVFKNFEYDDNIKPSFGVSTIFQIEPLPKFGDEALIEKNISENNMIKGIESGTEWIYEYNQYNLPESIETIWNGIETEEPMLLQIKYKEIE